jgi:oxygen-independent coproporphyrinogen-3 oxidase
MQNVPRSAYVHVPFCRHRCGYCNFTLVAGRDDLVDAYLEAIERELSWLGEPHTVDTLFFGGGTPTHLPVAKLRRLFNIVLRSFPLADGYEFSVEANPADLSDAKIETLGQHGVTRISVGAQSHSEGKLKFLDRDHSAVHVAQCLARARRHVQSIAVDLIFGVPGESWEIWDRDLTETMRLQADHVSTYGLTFERGTSLWTRWKKGQVQRLDDGAERAMFERAIDVLTAAGYEHYEVSNFARPGHRCRHNEVYWAGQEYFAVGPGAARYVNGRREVNHRSTTTYLRRVLAGRSPVAESEQLSAEDRAREALVIGMRRIRGVDRHRFAAQTGFELMSLAEPQLERFLDQGLLRWDGDHLCLTREGLLVSDSIWPYFLRA